MASGIYPGWQAGDSPSLSDPREPGPDRREVGRGPLSESQGRFKAIRLVERPAHFDRRKATMPGATPENALRKPQRTAVLRDASQGTQSPEYPPGFGVRQSSAAFWLGAETDR